MMIKKIKNNKVLSNISWILAGRFFYMLLNFIVGVISARYLGPSNYGLIGYAAAYTTFFTSICSLGINSIIVKEFIDNPTKEGEIIGSTLVLKLLSSIISLFTIIGISIVVDKGDRLATFIIFLYSISILFNIFETFKFWFQSKLESKYVEISTTVAYIVMAIYKIVLLVTGKSVKWFAFANSIEFIVVAIFLYSIYRKKGGPNLTFSINESKQLLKKSYHFIVSGLMIALYNSTDRFMLKQMTSGTEVGYYTTAVTISSLSGVLLSAIITSLTPVIMKAHNKNKEEYKKKNKQLYAIVFYISITISIFITLFSSLIIDLLYGKEYLASITVLETLTWYTAFSYLGVARDPWIVCEKLQNYLKYIYIPCAICNIILNYYMIPVNGAQGAALASLITQISTIFVFPMLIKELRPNVKLMIEAILLKGIKNKKI